MKYFQINAVFVIRHPKQIAVIAVRIDISAWKSRLLPHFGRWLSIFFKIIPEHALSEPEIETVKFGQHDLQRLLQQHRIDKLCERHADTVHIAHAIAGNHRKKMGSIIQLIPSDFPCRACRFHCHRAFFTLFITIRCQCGIRCSFLHRKPHFLLYILDFSIH